jgi:predicted esterase
MRHTAPTPNVSGPRGRTANTWANALASRSKGRALSSQKTKNCIKNSDTCARPRQATLCVDRRRVHATGISNGGMMVWPL